MLLAEARLLCQEPVEGDMRVTFSEPVPTRPVTNTPFSSIRACLMRLGCSRPLTPIRMQAVLKLLSPMGSIRDYRGTECGPRPKFPRLYCHPARRAWTLGVSQGIGIGWTSATVVCPSPKKVVSGSCRRITSFPGTSGSYTFDDRASDDLTSFTCSVSTRTSSTIAYAICL